MAVVLFTALTANASESHSSKTVVIDLPSALRLAGARNLDIQLARQKLAEAYATQESALEKFFPHVDLGATYLRHDGLIQDTSGNILNVHKQSYSPGATIGAQTDVGDAIFKSLEARRLAKAANHGLAAQRQDAILAAASGYFDLAAAYGAIGVAKEALSISSNYAAELDRAVKSGIAFKGDALRVKVQRQRDEIALRRAEEMARIQSANLVQILHLDPTVTLIPRDSRVVPVSLVSAGSPLSNLIKEALLARPEIKQNVALIAAAREAKNGAIYGGLIPTVSGQAFAGGLGGGENSDTGDFGKSEAYGAAVTWRIGPGGLFDFGNIHAKRARLRSANLAEEKVCDQIAREVVASRTRVLSLADQLTIARQSLSDAQEMLSLDQGRKEFGVGVVLEVILAEQDLTGARNEYLATAAEYDKAQYALLKALGRLNAHPAHHSRAAQRNKHNKKSKTR